MLWLTLWLLLSFTSSSAENQDEPCILEPKGNLEARFSEKNEKKMETSCLRDTKSVFLQLHCGCSSSRSDEG